MDEDFLVLGDLTEREDGVYVSRERHLIVRMFVGDKTFDEEITVPSLDELAARVEERIGQLRKKPDPDLLAEAQRPDEHPGHAIPLPSPPEEAEA